MRVDIPLGAPTTVPLPRAMAGSLEPHRDRQAPQGVEADGLSRRVNRCTRSWAHSADDTTAAWWTGSRGRSSGLRPRRPPSLLPALQRWLAATAAGVRSRSR